MIRFRQSRLGNLLRRLLFRCLRCLMVVESFRKGHIRETACLSTRASNSHQLRSSRPHSKHPPIDMCSSSCPTKAKLSQSCIPQLFLAWPYTMKSLCLVMPYSTAFPAAGKYHRRIVGNYVQSSTINMFCPPASMSLKKELQRRKCCQDVAFIAVSQANR